MINYSGNELSLVAVSKSHILSRFPAFEAVNQENTSHQSGRLLPECAKDAKMFFDDVYNKGTRGKKHQADSVQYGRSMIEMLGVLAIIGVLSVGGIAGYSKAMTKFKINKTIEQVSHIVANTRTLYSSQPNYGNITNAIIKKAHLAPDDMWGNENASSSGLINAFGGKVEIFSSFKNSSGDQKAFVVGFYDIPEDACIELATQDWGAATGSGLVVVSISADAASAQWHSVNCTGSSDSRGATACPNGSTVSIPMPIAVAAERCSGDRNIFSVKYY